MSKFNVLVNINAYEDSNGSQNPTMNYFKWTREINGSNASKPKSEEFILAPNESKTIFDGTRSLLQDSMTQYNLALKANTSNTYVLKYLAGTNPVIRNSRTTGADNTTQITITQNATLTTFTSTAGTPLNLLVGGVIAGDNVVISGPFNVANQVYGKILSVTATSFSIENASSISEVVTLVSVSDIKIFSASGIQKGDNLRIFGGFSPASFGTYEITLVTDDSIEFYSSKALASETRATDQLSVYYGSKSFVYVEADQTVELTVNGQSNGSIEPFIIGTTTKPAMFMKKSTMWSMTVTNGTINTVKVFYATIE